MIIQSFYVKNNINPTDLLVMACLFFSLNKKILVLLRKARFGRIRSNLKIAEFFIINNLFFGVLDVNSPL